jgi:endonuclease/exonuclease/phosphatase family metal-dependent hydrolase
MLKVMTLNINYYIAKHGAWLTRRDLIRQAIQEAEPDIIALQAVEADPTFAEGRDQATMLSRLLPEYRHVHFQLATKEPSGRIQGSAILARLPMTQTAALPLTLLPGLEDNNQRVVLAASFALPSGTLHVFDAHFSWVKEQALLNVREALPFAAGFQGDELIVGDLNNTSESEPMQQFRSAGWTDAWTMLHPANEGFTFESNQPKIRIDYAWMNQALARQVRAVEIIADRPGPGGTHASNHLGLLATFDLNPLRDGITRTEPTG